MRFIAALLIVIFLLPVYGDGAHSQATIPPVRPNVLLIVLDDAAYHTAAYMPNLDALASRGRNYTLAFSNSTGCNPSRVSFATGLLPICVDRMLETDWRSAMNACVPGQGDKVKTIYQTFSEAGYQTTAVGKVMHSATQQTAEFDESTFRQAQDMIPLVANRPIHGLTEFYASGNETKDWGSVEDLRGPNGETFTEDDLVDVGTTDLAIDAMAQTAQPWLVAVGLTAMHLPRYEPSRLLNKYIGVPVPDVLMNDYDDMPQEGRQRSVQNTQNRIVVRDILSYQDRWRRFNAAYYAGMEFADEQIGRLLASTPENTIVVLWSDHGYHLGQKLKIEKGALWREDYRVPLVVAGPGVEPAEIGGVTNSTEVYSMLLDLAGLAATDGIDRTPIDDGVIVFEGSAVLDDGRYAFIQYNAMNGLRKQQEFYDLIADPLEWRNTAAGPVTQYRQRLEAYLR